MIATLVGVNRPSLCDAIRAQTAAIRGAWDSSQHERRRKLARRRQEDLLGLLIKTTTR